MRGGYQAVVPLTFIVKRLIIINLAIWVVLILIAQRLMPQPYIFEWFGFIPAKFFQEFWVWQPFTYMFLHSENVFHLVFNMLLLWWLEQSLSPIGGGAIF